MQSTSIRVCHHPEDAIGYKPDKLLIVSMKSCLEVPSEIKGDSVTKISSPAEGVISLSYGDSDTRHFFVNTNTSLVPVTLKTGPQTLKVTLITKNGRGPVLGLPLKLIGHQRKTQRRRHIHCSISQDLHELFLVTNSFSTKSLKRCVLPKKFYQSIFFQLSLIHLDMIGLSRFVARWNTHGELLIEQRTNIISGSNDHHETKRLYTRAPRVTVKSLLHITNTRNMFLILKNGGCKYANVSNIERIYVHETEIVEEEQACVLRTEMNESCVLNRNRTVLYLDYLRGNPLAVPLPDFKNLILSHEICATRIGQRIIRVLNRWGLNALFELSATPRSTDSIRLNCMARPYLLYETEDRKFLCEVFPYDPLKRTIAVQPIRSLQVLDMSDSIPLPLPPHLAIFSKKMEIALINRDDPSLTKRFTIEIAEDRIYISPRKNTQFGNNLRCFHEMRCYFH
eukprot:TRINITY_DN3771_c0_g1_i7.p1 TRINITY_DN3771_c0_g1~~TRINITY_DN3771_c0_g1_i7.p1  ORF type:complete len:453 (+),score=33.88 TRINITY_DN3771_c0_g1_i7:204-1562(+)